MSLQKRSICIDVTSLYEPSSVTAIGVIYYQDIHSRSTLDIRYISGK